jgi:hypothetical protein
MKNVGVVEEKLFVFCRNGNKVCVIIPAFATLLITVKVTDFHACGMKPFYERQDKEMMKMTKPALVLWALLFGVPAVMAETTTEETVVPAEATQADLETGDDDTVEFVIADSVMEALSEQCLAESKEDKVADEELDNFMEICMVVKVQEQMDLAYEKAVAEAEAEAGAEEESAEEAAEETDN